MATFGTAPILDDFNRADSTTSIGGNWSIFGRSGSYDLGIISNQAFNPDAQWQFMYYNAAQYGPNCEVYVTISTLYAAAGQINLYCRLKDVTADAWAYDAYSMMAYLWNNSGTLMMLLRLYRNDNGTGTALGSGNVSVSNPINGFRFGMSAIGNTLTGYYDNGSGWVQAMSVTDNTYGNAGYFGLYYHGESTSRIDNFGGGTLGQVIPKAMRLQQNRRR